MARKYRVRNRDTLREIAERFYREAECFEKLALYNGILDPDRIGIEQWIEIPSKRELLGASLPRGRLVRPHGLEEILSTFGDIYDFILDDGTLDPRWESEYLARTQLPFPIPLSWEPSTVVRSLYCHSRLGELFAEVFSVLDIEGLRGAIRTYGGCFNFRSKRTHSKLSSHSWGISIDLNPETNGPGEKGDMEEAVVNVFRSFGFEWGGDWSYRSKDPMHFQFCTGY